MKQPITKRAPLTDDELRVLSSDEWIRLKLTDEERARLREINRQVAVERAKSAAQIALEEKPILMELRDIGLDVDSVWDLVNSRTPYPEAIPLLLSHLYRPYSDVIREGLARALAVPEKEVKKAWPQLVEEYRRTPDGLGYRANGDTIKYRFGAKEGLACTLAAAVTNETLPELIELVGDRTLGQSRVLLLRPLRRRRGKSTAVQQALVELANDPDLCKEIESWSKK